MQNSTNQQCVPTALLEREKETEERMRKRKEQEEKRQQLYEQEKNEPTRSEINELEELFERDTIKCENRFAAMPKGYCKISKTLKRKLKFRSLKTKTSRRRNRKKYVKKYTDLDTMILDLKSGVVKNVDFSDFRNAFAFQRLPNFNPSR